ncbi:hypothetical protein [Arsenicibacter rosenii]|uniref:hypothetical protein n=1 Tax=Arsenicibacter rosenii TaxID=1750698 RepID=UPI0011606F19|nr:hypothetical protein [Arsenicibacter rosenii]
MHTRRVRKQRTRGRCRRLRQRVAGVHGRCGCRVSLTLNVDRYRFRRATGFLVYWHLPGYESGRSQTRTAYARPVSWTVAI